MADDDEDSSNWLAVSTDIQSGKNDGISCEIGIPTLE